MSFIAFLGCDGSGKSAVIGAVAGHMRAAGEPVTLGHWRPVAFGKRHKTGGGEAADDPHGSAPRGLAGSVLKLFWLGINWWVGWFRFLRWQAKTGVVIFDRYHVDLTLDPRRYRYGGPMWLARWACRWMPQPDMVFYLDAPPDVLLARKQEVPKASLEKSRAAYLRLARGNARIHVIDAARPLDEVVEDVLGRILLRVGR